MLSSMITNISTLHDFLADIGNDDCGIQATKETLKEAIEKHFMKYIYRKSRRDTFKKKQAVKYI